MLFGQEDTKQEYTFVRGKEPEGIPLVNESEENGYTLWEYPKVLIDEENRYKQKKFGELNPEKTGGGISQKSKQPEEKEARFFSSDPIKDKIMCGYWGPLRAGFQLAIQRGGPEYLIPIIQRYFDLEKGHFDWHGSEITRFERDYLDKNFGIGLPRRVAKDESWETFLDKIKPTLKTDDNKEFVQGLQREFKHYLPLSLQSRQEDITKDEPPDTATNPIELIDHENRYKNQKFNTINPGAKAFLTSTPLQAFSSNPKKDQIMQAYWPRLKKSFEEAGDPNQPLQPYITVIIQRYYEMQQGHFDSKGSTINNFEWAYLNRKHQIQLPEKVGKYETWKHFVEKITADSGVDLLRTVLLANPPLMVSTTTPATIARMPNGPMPPAKEPGTSEESKDARISTHGMQNGLTKK